MIHLPTISFGYGVRIGAISVLKEQDSLNQPINQKDCALTFPFLPNGKLFSRVSKASGVEFCILPPCSAYSHLGASTWFLDIPTMAIEQPWLLVDGLTVLADFDNDLLLVAESESESEELQKRFRERRITGQPFFSDFKKSQSGISVLAETTSANDVFRALADGADGLSVIRAEHLFSDVSGISLETKAFIDAIKANPQVFPLPIRFFDPEQESWNVPKKVQLPQGYLGYRGVRILEIDDTWFQQFVAGIEMLDLEQIVVVLPMVTLVSEVKRIKKRFGHKWDRIGVTVETPAAALRIEEILEVADFIQIGLNDLTQYTMAWDRDVPNPERLPNDRIVEPVADFISSVATVCNIAGVPYTLGMDLRPNKDLAAQVQRIGVKSVSCAPSLIKPWKKALSLIV